jgi:hypothetical protein
MELNDLLFIFGRQQAAKNAPWVKIGHFLVNFNDFWMFREAS